MSAMTATVQHDKIIMMSDACFYDEDGTIAFFDHKVFPVPGLPNAAFSSRGAKMAFDLFITVCLHHKLEDWEDFVFEKLTAIWSDFDALMLEAGRRGGQQVSAELMIAGWNNKKNRGEVLFRHNHPVKLSQKNGEGLIAGRTYFNLLGHFACGPDSALMGNPSNFDPARRGIRAFNTAREALNDLTCGQRETPVLGHSVGGWIDSTVITPTSVVTTTIHRWPDTVGAKIDPFAMPQSVAA